MKLFLDTNIFMDMLFGRENAPFARQIIQSIQNRKYEGYAADITLLNSDYVAKKQGQEIRQFYILLQIILSLWELIIVIYKALELDNCDLEDNVQALLL